MNDKEIALPFFSGGGEMGARIRAVDWAATPMGAAATWPQPLRSALSICLNSSFPTAIYWGPELRLFYNDAWSHIPAERHPGALGRPAREVWADIWPVIEPQFRQVIERGEGVATFDQMLPMERGGKVHETYWNYSLTPIIDDAGRVGGIFNQGHETTEQVLGRRHREAQIERLREMFQQAPGAVALLRGPQHIFEVANNAYMELVGRGDLIGKPVASVLPEVIVQGFIDLLDRVYLTGEPYLGHNVSVRLQRRGGVEFEERILDFVYQPIRRGDEVTGIFVQVSDVTDRALAELALQSLNTTLEQRVTQEVARRSDAEQKLHQMQKMEAIGQLTGGIAHDFNNMLAVVIGGLNLLRRRLARGDTDINTYIDGAIEGAQRAASLTQRLLAFARQQPLEPVSIDVNAMLGDMTELLTRTIGETIRIETHLPTELWLIRADRNQLESVILNLVVNARDAMTAGGTITISTSNAVIDETKARELGTHPGEYVLITVADVGCGMIPEVRARAFDPFFTTKAVGEGTGLGLSQAFGFVNQSGGHVKIDSEVNRGTTVSVFLPRSREALLAIAPRPVEAIPHGQADEVILVVEDEPRVRALSVDALRDLGYTVLSAASASEALKVIETEKNLSLLFTDIVMPETSGRELAEAVLKKLPHLKIVLTSGYARDEGGTNGANRFGGAILSKPFSIEQLATRIREALDS